MYAYAPENGTRTTKYDRLSGRSKSPQEQQLGITSQYLVQQLRGSHTNNTNFVAMDNNQVSVQLAFNGFNPGPNGLGGITLTGWPSSINQRVDKNGNITYTFNVMGAALFAQVTVRMSYGSSYATATVTSNTNGRELTFSGNLVPYSQSNIFQSGFSF